MVTWEQGGLANSNFDAIVVLIDYYLQDVSYMLAIPEAILSWETLATITHIS